MIQMRSKAFALALFLTLSASQTFAQPAPPATSEKADALTKRAFVLYNNGDFLQAAALFHQAYENTPNPRYLFDQAQCYRLAHDREKALFFYGSYLRTAPDAPNRAIVEKFIAELNAQPATSTTSPAATTPPTLPAPLQPTLPNSQTAATNPTANSPSDPQPSEQDGSILGTWWFWTAAVVVVGGATGGLLLALQPKQNPAIPAHAMTLPSFAPV